MAQKLKLDIPKVLPHKNIENYVSSKKFYKEVSRKTETDNAASDPSIDLVQLQCRLIQFEEILKLKREYYENQCVQLDGRWSELEKKQDTLRMGFRSFNEFVKKNMDKRERAKQHKEDSLELLNRRIKEVGELTEQINSLKTVKKNMEDRIAKFRIYENFLENVIKIEPEFKNVNDILTKYEILMTTKATLIEKQNTQLLILENASSAMSKMMDKFTFQVIGLKNEQATLSQRHQQAHSQVHLWEQVVLNILNKMNDYIIMKEMAKKSARDLYVLLCRRKRLPLKLKKQDTEKQLQFVKKELSQLRKLNKKCEQSMKFASTHVTQPSHVE